MTDLLANVDKNFLPKVGELIKAVVISAGRNEVLLDINGIITGIVRGKELEDESGEYSSLKEGDEVEATVLESENERGLIELSFRYAGHQRAWEGLQELKNKAEIITCRVVDANKGGLMCRVGGVVGFLPVSQLTPEHYPRVEGGDKNKILEILKRYTNTDFEVKVIDVDEREEKLIVSEKAAWEEKQGSALKKYRVGANIQGKISGVVDFGAFVSFDDNMEGLVHISELAWQRIDNPRDVVRVGQEVEAKIIGVEGSKISLSLKALRDDPWSKVTKKFKVGDVVKGKVLKLNNFGAFVELDEKIHGLAHLSELATHEIKDPAEVLEIGQEYKFKIVSLDVNEHRLGLSIKALSKKEEKKEEKKDEPKKEEVKKGEKKVEKEVKKEEKPEEKKETKTKAESKKQETKKEVKKETKKK